MQCTKKGTIAHSCIAVRWACSEAPPPLPRSTTLLHRRCGNVLPVHDGTLLPLRRAPFANSHSKVPGAAISRSRTSGPKTSFPPCLSLCLLTPSAGSRGPLSANSPIGPSDEPLDPPPVPESDHACPELVRCEREPLLFRDLSCAV